MKTVKIHKSYKQMLKEYSNGTLNENLSKLLSNFEDKLPVVDIDYSPVSTMQISEENIDKLSAYKIVEGESHESVIVRMLILAQTLYTDAD